MHTLLQTPYTLDSITRTTSPIADDTRDWHSYVIAQGTNRIVGHRPGTEENVRLAAEQLVQARDRFAAGVANNLEVVQAQQAVAVAEENFISSLYAFNLSKAAIGRSTGRAQDIPSDFLGVSK